MAGMESVVTILEREGEALEVLLFKLVETELLLDADEARFLPRATREVERARARAREIDLLRAATVARVDPAATLRAIAADASGPWPAILRDHHDVLTRLVEEIDVVAHRNARAAQEALARLGREVVAAPATPVAAGVGAPAPDGSSGRPFDALLDVVAPRRSRPVRNAELDRLARGAALETVFGTAARLRMPDLVDFLR